MQTETARRADWFAGAGSALPAARRAVRDVRSRRRARERVAVGVLIALAAAGATVLGFAVALAPALYTPFF